jgi:hypothetical protein
MKNRKLTYLATSILLAILLVGIVFATTFLEDDFNDNYIDPDKWITCDNAWVDENSGSAATYCQSAVGSAGAYISKNSYSFVSNMDVEIEVVANPVKWCELVLSNEDYSPMSDHRRYILRIYAKYNWNEADTDYYIQVYRQEGTTQYLLYNAPTPYNTGALKIHRWYNTAIFFWRDNEIFHETWQLETNTVYVIFGAQAGRDVCLNEEHLGWMHDYCGVARFDNFELWD